MEQDFGIAVAVDRIVGTAAHIEGIDDWGGRGAGSGSTYLRQACSAPRHSHVEGSMILD